MPDAEYMRQYRAKRKTKQVAEDVVSAEQRLDEATEEIARLKKQISKEALSGASDPAETFNRRAKAAVAAKRAQKALRKDLPDDYVEIIRSMTQDQRDAIIKKLPKTGR